VFEIAFIAKAVAVLRLDLADSDSYQIVFNPPLACKAKVISEQIDGEEVFVGGAGIGKTTVLTPNESGPSHPDLTQDARKRELSVPMLLNRLPSAIFVPAALYQ
jgi:hypothetical protein